MTKKTIDKTEDGENSQVEIKFEHIEEGIETYFEIMEKLTNKHGYETFEECACFNDVLISELRKIHENTCERNGFEMVSRRQEFRDKDGKIVNFPEVKGNA